MCKNNESTNHEHKEVAELNNYQELKHTQFALETETNKALDVSLMTGNSELNKKGSEEK